MSAPVTVANRFADLIRGAFGAEPAVRVRAWDGSEAGPAAGPVLVLRDRAVLRRALWRGRLGVAEAYLAGEVDVEGDVTEALSRLLAQGRQARPGAGSMLRAAALALRLGAVGPRPAAPLAPVRLSGQRHTRTRDQAVIAYHYDLSNEFYQLLLDPTMAYSCGYWTRPEDPGYRLADAQRDKLDLICRKLGLGPGMHLLDVGCGWGSLTLHAAVEYGVQVTAITLSAEQADYVAAWVAELDLIGRVEVRLCDYRDLDDGPYDAVACVEMGEHVGAECYPAFAASLRALVRPGGRALIQQMSRTGQQPGGGAFIEAYVAADMHMRPVGETVALLERAGWEVRDVHAMREHYGRTVRTWLTALEEQWPRAVDLIGEPAARMWRLYLAGGALAFDEGRMGVDQILAVRPRPEGSSELPPTRAGFER